MDAECYKIVCTDPNDEIIADASSLKAGIALRLELGDMDTLVPRNQNISPRQLASFDLETLPLAPLPVVGHPLTNEMIESFYRVLLILSSHAAAIRSQDEANVVLNISNDIQPADVLRLWYTIASIDGCCGQTLSQSMAHGFEGLRTWVSTLLVWGARVHRADEVNLTFNDLPMFGKTTEMRSSPKSLNRVVNEFDVVSASPLDFSTYLTSPCYNSGLKNIQK